VNVAEFFVELLLREGVSHVFTVPGGTALPLMAAIAKRPQLRTVVCKNELGAAFMADGYAWGSGKLGVIVTIGGPGATNATTGLCCSAAQGNPVLLVSGEVATSAIGRRAAQDGSTLGIDVAAISRPATALSVGVASPSEAVTALEEAVRRAMYERKPAHVSIPLDVQRASVAAGTGPRPRAACAELATLSPTGVRRAVELLRAPGQRVALLVGRGASDARAEILKLAEQLGAPVATTCGGKGLFPERHPLSLGVFSFGGGPLGRAVMTSGLDVLLAIGTGLGEFATMNYSEALKPQRALIHVDREPSVFGRNYQSVPVCGDAREVCRALLAELAGDAPAAFPPWLSAMQAKHQRLAEPEKLDDSAVPIRPERLMRELENALPKDACLVADIGTSCLFVAHCVRLSPPQRCYIPMVWSCMGHPLGAALGVRIGADRPTICVAGDAAFLATGLELHAAVEQGVSNFVWVVLSNRGHGLVRLGTAAIIGDDHGVEDGTFGFCPDVAQIARALGAAAISVRHPDELAPALAHGLACGRPCVIDVHVDPSAKPPMADRIQGLGNVTRAGDGAEANR
jgi:acetolactate synthase-1/2/3 large subunit